MTINISLPAEMEARVREHVASGLYGSASEVVREALRLFDAYQSVRMSTLVALKADLDKGVADLRAGRVVPMDMATLKAEGRARRSKHAP
ncbi:MAG: type II toxin-antitoxin system ParD family antitoxin [Hydrogenophaga sp.]|uniref:type II toxin-antitoxin system ParD family antitoxin n=1 Tax=Hydrogenophaga sp. TaxID=1904254 RepID=UPI002749A928|nr:type II toxin-antitoxin system ParD family antitoxin [Hydrogenophaga sp.]MDP2416605.1 type II toxin-antitoxin system ParD family antitoxin [Hydrogenophaga sp.]MDZ4189348.1 type II toxin-antitoxin system ParD family antitoxin [Hydrogenophaga sp.]